MFGVGTAHDFYGRMARAPEVAEVTGCLHERMLLKVAGLQEVGRQFCREMRQLIGATVMVHLVLV